MNDASPQNEPETPSGEERSAEKPEETPEGPDDLLYHYTTAKGFYGIIKGNALWASSISSVNDAVEVEYPIELIADVLRSDIRKKKEEYGCTRDLGGLRKASPEDRREIEILIGFLDATLKFPRTLVDEFVCSFSADGGDSLTQWRAYAGKHSGFSIGFSHAILEKLARDQGFRLEECIYNPKIQKRVVRQYIVGNLSEFNPPSIYTSPISPDDAWTGALMHCVSIFKHPSFESEKERRLFVTPSQDITATASVLDKFVTGSKFLQGDTEYRDGEAMIIPYYKFLLKNDPSPIKLIRVGPSPSHDAALANAQDFCNKKMPNANIKVEPSAVPYPN